LGAMGLPLGGDHTPCAGLGLTEHVYGKQSGGKKESRGKRGASSPRSYKKGGASWNPGRCITMSNDSLLPRTKIDDDCRGFPFREAISRKKKKREEGKKKEIGTRSVSTGHPGGEKEKASDLCKGKRNCSWHPSAPSSTSSRHVTITSFWGDRKKRRPTRGAHRRLTQGGGSSTCF